MKYLSQLITFILLTITVQAGIAQNSSIDANRLNRDINIMDNILSELFRVKNVNSQNVRLVSDFSSRSARVRGTYLNDYGMIFQVSNPGNNFLTVGSDNENKRKIVFEYSDSDEEVEVTAENVKDRIIGFLMDYGSTIGQLGDNEHVRVIFGGMPRSNRSIFDLINSVGGRFQTSVDSEQLPVISVSAQRSDLAAYRSGNLTEQQFRDRVNISETERNRSRDKDLRVMANIFKTAFGDNNEGVEVRGSVDYLKLDNFGALFFFDARFARYHASYFSHGQPFNIVFQTDSVEKKSVEITQKALQEKQRKAEQKQAERAEKMATEFQQFVQDLKEYIVDYGRTLSSIQSDQYILTSVTINGHGDRIPERIDLQIRKSVLESMDKGSITREQALNQIVLREY